jgi:predicted RNA-binding Zn-ribbon protein involved in translation (DUF1610 family)
MSKAKKEEIIAEVEVEVIPKSIMKLTKEEPVGYPCSKCGMVMRVTGGGKSGTDYHCDNCGANINIMEAK